MARTQSIWLSAQLVWISDKESNLKDSIPKEIPEDGIESTDGHAAHVPSPLCLPPVKLPVCNAYGK
ncbi:hypothetical protein VSDG_08832 [Cytospora chrysosperma]|uniref:Uncharacterized protein n=1 Tax=Cytospora chrysosperma TaxID=252740 RepID=A0A423VDU9_CYTCH|nr:hypothetical protein VSDG_08832 [Valsa sordida]